MTTIAGAALMTQAGFTITLAVLAAVFALVTAGFAVVRESAMSATSRPTARATRLGLRQRHTPTLARVCRCDDDEFVLQGRSRCSKRLASNASFSPTRT